MYKKNSVKKNAILNAFRMALTVLVPLITFPYIARVFSANGIGTLNFANSVVTIFALFASLGIYTYGVREGTKVRDSREKFSLFAQELLIINVIATILVYIVFFVSVKCIPSFSSSRKMLLIYGVTIFFTALGCDWVYGTYEEYSYITIRQIYIQVFTIVAMFIFVHSEHDIYIWAAISVISVVGANVFNVIHARKYISFAPMKKYHIKKHIKPIMLLFFTQLAAKVYSNVDTVLLGLLADNYCTGVYSAAVKINNIMITIFAAMSPVFVPKIMQCIEKNDVEEYNFFLNKIIKVFFLMGIPSVIGLEILRRSVIDILTGTGFERAYTTMAILTPIILITSFTNVIYYDVLIPYNKEKQVMVMTIITTIINIGVSCVLIPIFKENGAAIGSFIAELAGLVIALAYAFKEKLIQCRVIPNPIKYLVGGILIMVVGFLCEKMIQNIWLLVIETTILGGVVYFVCMLLAKESIVMEMIELIKIRYKKK